VAFSTSYVIGFAAAVCVVCSLGVAGAAMGLRDLQDANKQNAFQKKILEAVDLPAAENGKRPRLSKDEVSALYDSRIKLILVDPDGNEVMADAPASQKVDRISQARAAARAPGAVPEVSPVYLRVSGDQVEGYAVEMVGKGLWGPISGFLALEPDAKTVMNVSFDPHGETPGLGAEIAQPPFMGQWRGKKISGSSGLTPIRVVKGSADLACPGRTEHCVDGVSGATITSRGVDQMVEQAISKNYASYLKNIQSGR
jgi:Na+-transporting NADH:ubiquinone oxidoreductase subunit C